MKKNLIFCLCLMLGILVPGMILAADAVPVFSITNCKIISHEYNRVTKLWKLTLNANATNSGTDAENVKAFVAINDPHMTVIDGELNFDNIPAGSTKASTDTFSMWWDRNFPLNEQALVWSFFFLPPDPGDAGKQTLLGIDSDNDGVRDDIQRYIYFTYPNEKKVRLALTQIARDFQTLLPDAADPDKALENVKKMNCSDSCLDYIKGGVRNAMKLSDALMAEILNTKERSFAYITFSNSLAGKTATLPPLAERKNCCLFDVDSIGGN